MGGRPSSPKSMPEKNISSPGTGLRSARASCCLLAPSLTCTLLEHGSGFLGAKCSQKGLQPAHVTGQGQQGSCQPRLQCLHYKHPQHLHNTLDMHPLWHSQTEVIYLFPPWEHSKISQEGWCHLHLHPGVPDPGVITVRIGRSDLAWNL